MSSKLASGIWFLVLAVSIVFLALEVAPFVRQPAQSQAQLSTPPSAAQPRNEAEDRLTAAAVSQAKYAMYQTALAGVGLFATLVLLFFTNESLKATKDSLFVLHRPRFQIRHVVVDGIDSGVVSGSLTNGYVWVVNTGESDGVLLKVHTQWILSTRLPLVNPALHALDETSQPKRFPPSAFDKIKLPDWEGEGLQGIRAIWHDNQGPASERLYLIGYIKYGETDRTRLRRRYFAFRYSRKAKRFVEVMHANYNYED